MKEVAQIGAVIGREFSHELLASVVDLPEEKLEQSLSQLLSSELVFRRGTPPDAVYSFKHVLVQDAAYQSLLKSKRQQLHARIARVLQERFPETAENRPEVLAHHFAEADLRLQAVSYYRQAGEAVGTKRAQEQRGRHGDRDVTVVDMKNRKNADDRKDRHGKNRQRAKWPLEKDEDKRQCEQEQQKLTQTGMVLGTPLYMSPEQARGDDDLDHRVDIYALGVIMYEAACGRVPFAGTNYLSVISQVLNSEPAPLRSLRPERAGSEDGSK